MLGLLLGAVVLGVIVSVMEGDFPEFLPLLGCVIVVSAASFVTSLLIGETENVLLAFAPLVVAAGAGGVAISGLLGMTVKRASIAAGIYLFVNLLIAVGFLLVFGD